jgi:3-phenylpropionate/cinnamic acid dioxygenase small subunit
MSNALTHKPESNQLMEVEQLLYREAYYLDQRRWDDWLALYTDDARYWVPLEAGQTDPYTTSSIIHDDRTLLEIRIRQYSHTRAHARRPLPRTCHQIGNVMLLGEAAGALTVASTLTLVEYRLDQQRVWAAGVEHQLRHTAAGLKIALKRVDLVNSEAELDGISILF